MSDWLDGPKLVAWLEEEGFLRDARAQLGDAHVEAVRKWRDGRAANVYSADELLLCLGLTIAQLPESVYRENPRLGVAVQQIDIETTERIVALAEKGKNFSQIAREVGCDSKTAARYVRTGVAA